MLDFIKESFLLSENQLGFKEKRRTFDNVLLLKLFLNIIETKQKFYTAFIYLCKAFDSVWRTGNVYIQLAKSAKGLSKYFTSESGLKQGFIFSHFLSSIFIDSIIDELNT